eukprot:TRINITY_DN75619_c0_g1_i1.p1 TRINITY_DN75619_c0_g1~~TRINITY_DN75619_c0_g1_i1.p1  ORF type:complete len:298 (-),score=51.36 TRINITY_DN75619_c0_g1_i1:226-1119(-)
MGDGQLGDGGDGEKTTHRGSREKLRRASQTARKKNEAAPIHNDRLLPPRLANDHSTQKYAFATSHLAALGGSRQEELLKLKTSKRLQAQLLDVVQATLQEDLMWERLKDLRMDRRPQTLHRKQRLTRSFLHLVDVMDKLTLSELLKWRRCRIDWMAVSKRLSAVRKYPGGRHSFSAECCALVFCHYVDPTVNREALTASEVAALQKGQQATGGFHWDEVAAMVGGSRTAWQCFAASKRHSDQVCDEWLQPPHQLCAKVRRRCHTPHDTSGDCLDTVLGEPTQRTLQVSGFETCGSTT